MKIAIVLLAMLLCGCGIGARQAPKDEVAPKEFIDGIVSFCNTDLKERKVSDVVNAVEFNGEIIAEIKMSKIFAYSIKNGLLTISAIAHKPWGKDGSYSISYPDYTVMYSIDLESKAIIKEERLGLYFYKDLDLELLRTEDSIYCTQKGETHKAAFSNNRRYAEPIYISKDGYIVFSEDGIIQSLSIFSMDKNYKANLGGMAFELLDTNYHYYDRRGFYIPFNEYVAFLPVHTLEVCASGICADVYLYNYEKDSIYATRYKKADIKTIKDSIELNIKSGNVYEQFFPLTKIDTAKFNADRENAGGEFLERLFVKCFEFGNLENDAIQFYIRFFMNIDFGVAKPSKADSDIWDDFEDD